MIKILKGEKVYIPVREIEKKGIHIAFPPYAIERDPNYGELVTENNFNAFLYEDEKALDKNNGYPELTKVTSLRARIDDIKSLAPLKYMFLTSMGNSEDDAIQRIQAEAEKDIIKEINNILDTNSYLACEYKKRFQFLLENSRNIATHLKKCDLDMQYLTEISDGKPGLICFFAGNNVFYQMYLQDFSAEDFDRLQMNDDGTLVIPEPQEYEDSVITPFNPIEETVRDFRDYSVRENLLWCLRNLPLKNDFNDELSYHQYGIHFYINIKAFVKLINPHAFPEMLFVDGVFGDISEDTFCTQKPEK